jgi:hypothetical protein
VLDASIVVSKVGTETRQKILLSPASPDIIVDGGQRGGRCIRPQGQVVTCQSRNDFSPTTSWAAVAGTQAISASTRRAFPARRSRQRPDHDPVQLTPLLSDPAVARRVQEHGCRGEVLEYRCSDGNTAGTGLLTLRAV